MSSSIKRSVEDTALSLMYVKNIFLCLINLAPLDSEVLKNRTIYESHVYKNCLVCSSAYTPLIQPLLFSVINLYLPYLHCPVDTYCFGIIAIFNILFNILLLMSP